MFGLKKNTSAERAVLDDEISAVTEETSQEAADAALLAKGHPSMFLRRQAVGDYEAWLRLSTEERDSIYESYHTDLDAYHDAYLRVHGVECRDCTC